jgi:hypothetical protein
MSYQNTLVMEEDGEVVGVAIFYDGAKARELDEPLEWAAAKKVGAFRLLYPHRTGSVGVLHGYP